MYCGARNGPGGELFDGASGTNSQSRYSPREEILRRIEECRMKRLMEAALEETEREEQENRTAAFQAEIRGKHARGVVDRFSVI
jgi:hypothetical protein